VRLAVLAVIAACGHYDPIDEIPHRDFPDTEAAIRAILDDHPALRVYAIGEYHPTVDTAEHDSPLARFVREILPLLPADHLVIEAWYDASCAGTSDPVQVQIEAATRRPPKQATDLSNLLARMPAHGLPMTCIEHASVLDPQGRVDFYRLLAMVTTKLAEATRQLLDGGRDVVVYGGALHNDLYPKWPLEELAYAHALARDVGVLEIDLAVPEVIAPVRSLWGEDWFPLLGKASPERAIVWERGPRSYVVMLPARSDAVARLARPGM
jgi:hypothetical protein